MKVFFTIMLLYVSMGCFSQSDTSLYSKLLPKPFCYEDLASFDFESALNFDYPSLQSKQEKRSSVALTTHLLCGGWQAEAMGNNWGDYPQRLVRPDKRMVFDGDSVFFYCKGKLERATTYRLVLLQRDTFSSMKTLIAFNGSGETWRLALIEPGEDVPWHSRATKLYLLFNREPNCVCGCPEELYSQEIPSEANRH